MRALWVTLLLLGCGGVSARFPDAAISNVDFAPALDAGSTSPPPVDASPVEPSAVDASTISSSIKWHPGHYILSPARPTSPSLISPINELMNKMAAVVDPATNKPAMQGYLGTYSWYWLEPQKGVYNTSIIDADLATLAALSAKYGKTYRLIIQLVFDSANTEPHSIPTTPQVTPYSSASSSYVGVLPDYIIDGVSGQPDAVKQVYGLGISAAWWRPAVMERYIALVTYLGQRYDGNANVEMIIPMDQISDGADPIPSDLTEAAVDAAWKSLLDATAKAWPTTNRIITNNFGGSNYSLDDLIALSAYAANERFGMGGPDLSDPPYLAWSEGELIITGAGTSSLDGFETANFGTTDYRGTIPMAFQQQQGGYLQGVTAAQFESFAWGEMKTSHMIWENDALNDQATMTWDDVVAALQAQHFRIHDACPTTYPACDSN